MELKFIKKMIKRLFLYSDKIQNEKITLAIQSHTHNLRNIESELNLLQLRIDHLQNTLFQFKDTSKITIGFLVHNANLFISSYSVYLSLKEECQVIVYATTNNYPQFEHYAADEKIQKNMEALYKHYNIKARPIATIQDLIAQGIPDILFLQTPFDEHRPENFSAKFLSNFTKICYIPYSITVAELPSFHYGIDFFNYCWRIFLESPESIDMCKQHLDANTYEKRKKKISISGHPKLDLLKNHIVNNEKIDTCWNLPRSADIKRIIWAPHWSIKWFDKNGFCQFKKYYSYFLKLLTDQTKIDLVMRPHELMFDALIKHNEMTLQEVDNFMEEFTSHKNASIDTTEIYLDLFHTSDAMITDGVSFLAEYQITKKPIIYTENTDNGPILNQYGMLLVSGLYKAHNEHDLDHFINEVVFRGQDDLYNARIQALENHLYHPSIGSGEYIKMDIIENLRLAHKKQLYGVS